MFNLEKARKEAGISKIKFQRIKKEVKKDFPNDSMMFELHVLRYIDFLKRKSPQTNK